MEFKDGCLFLLSALVKRMSSPSSKAPFSFNYIQKFQPLIYIYLFLKNRLIETHYCILILLELS